MKYSKFIVVLLGLFMCACASDEDETPPPPPPDLSLLSISDASTDEGEGYFTVNVQLQLDAAADADVTATISTNDGTAEAAKDFIPINGQTVTFTAGETTKSVEVTIVGDLIFEEDETFEVTITNVSGPATIEDGTATVSLVNDDVMEAQEVPVNLEIDWEALQTQEQWSELPYEIINFGQPSNIPNAEFTSVAAVSDTIFFNPQFSNAGDTILYWGIDFGVGFDPGAYLEYIGFFNYTRRLGFPRY